MYYMFMCVSCFSLVVNLSVGLLPMPTFQVIGLKDSSGDALMSWGDYLHKSQVEDIVCVHFSFVCFVGVAVCFPRPYDISYAWHDPIKC